MKVIIKIFHFLMITFICLFSGLSFAKGPKAVSLDSCADQYLLALADKDQIISVSKQSLATHSYYRDRAKQVKTFDATLEQILYLNPTIILATEGAYNVLPALKNNGIKASTTTYGHKPDVVYQNILKFSELLEKKEAGRKLIEIRKNQLDHLNNLPKRKQTILYLTPSGFTAGVGTYVDDIIKMSGFISYAEKHNIISWQPLSLEQVILNPPDLIITNYFNQKNVHVSHWSLTRHPKINELMKNIPTIDMPGPLFSCGGLFAAEAATYIRKNAETLINEEED